MDPSVCGISSDHVVPYSHRGRRWCVLGREENVKCKGKRNMEVLFLDVRNKLKENKEVKPSGTSAFVSMTLHSFLRHYYYNITALSHHGCLLIDRVY